MTTIAYDGKMLAWDGLVTTGPEIITRHGKDKIRLDLHDDGNVIFGIAGCLALLPALIEWFGKGYDPSEMPESSDGSRTVFFAMGHRKGLFPERKMREKIVFSSDCPYPDYSYSNSKAFAVGSGQDYATGAMFAGASAVQAVRIAADCDVYTGGEIYFLDVEAAMREGKGDYVNGGKITEWDQATQSV